MDRPASAQGSLVPAWTVSAAYAVLLLCIPTRLVVGPIGAPGTPANLLAIVGLFLWLCFAVGGLSPVRGLTPVRIALALFTSAALISYASGHIRGWSQPADIHQRSDRLWRFADVPEVTATVMSAADRGLLALAGWAGILLVTAEGVRSWRDVDRLLTWIVWAGTFVASLGIIQYFTGINVAGYLRVPGLQSLTDFGNALSRSDLNRIVSTSAHPIELGVAMASLLPLALHRSLHRRRLTAWLPTMLIGTAALMSVSRSAIVVAGAALVVLFLGWPLKWRIWALVAAPALALVGRSVLPGLLGSIRSLFTDLSADPSIQGRTDDYALVIRLVGDQPLSGQGLFTFVPMLYRTIDNQVLVLLLEVGIIGTAAFALLVGTAVAGGLAPRRNPETTTEQRHLGLAVAASLIGIVTSYATFDALSFRQVAGLTFLYVGLGGAVWRLSGVAVDSSGAISPAALPVDAAVPANGPARRSRR